VEICGLVTLLTFLAFLSARFLLPAPYQPISGIWGSGQQVGADGRQTQMLVNHEF